MSYTALSSAPLVYLAVKDSQKLFKYGAKLVVLPATQVQIVKKKHSLTLTQNAQQTINLKTVPFGVEVRRRRASVIFGLNAQRHPATSRTFQRALQLVKCFLRLRRSAGIDL